MIESRIENSLAFANEYGICVIPVEYQGKMPLVKWTEYQNRRSTKEEIDRWFNSGRKNNLAFVCGSVSGRDGLSMIVIDFDHMDLYNSLRPDGSKTRAVKTGRGVHEYFFLPGKLTKYPMKIDMGNGIISGIDIQAEGSYVVSPGSVNSSGNYYKWLNDLPIAILQGESPEHFKNLLYTKIDIACEKFGWKRIDDGHIHDITQHLNGVQEGNRNNIGYLLASYYKQTDLSQEETLEKLFAWNEKNQPPLPPSGILSVVKSAYKLGAKTGFRFKGISGSSSGLDNKYRPDGKIRPDLIALNIMETDNYITIRDTGEILYYKDGIYNYHGGSIIKEKCVTGFGGELNRYYTEEVKHQIIARTYVERDELNSNIDLIHLNNGIFNITSMELQSFTPDIYATVKIPIFYDSSADCPIIEKFLDDILEEKDILKIQELFGYCLLRDCRFQKAFLFHGERDNGKSTLIELLRSLLGKKNTSHQTLQNLVKNRFAAADLHGKLANLRADLGKNALSDTGIFRELVTGDPVQVEKKGQQFFTLKNHAKLIFSANELPAIHDDISANWKRIMIINFPKIIPQDKQDKKILTKLTTEEELSGLFNWTVGGLKRLLNNNEFTGSEDVDTVREKYIWLSDSLKAYVDKCIVSDINMNIDKDTFLKMYYFFCKQYGLLPKAKGMVTKQLPMLIPTELRRHGPTTNRKYIWAGIRFKDDDDKSVLDVQDVQDNSLLSYYKGDDSNEY